MRRAIVVVGEPAVAPLPRLREFSIVSLPRLPRGGTARSWEAAARDHGFELIASWLVVRAGDAFAPPGLFAGCRIGVSPSHLTRVISAIDARAGRSRVVTDGATIAARCAALRQSGKRIVFTNGVFDLFHVGHLRLLQQARARGDALVVGINSDDSARRLKGRSRPMVPQFARAQIVAAVRGVDLCAIFEQDDPRALLRLVHPDVLVKGSEYRKTEVVGGGMVERWGGTVRLVDHVPGWSATRVMGALKGRRS